MIMFTVWNENKFFKLLLTGLSICKLLPLVYVQFISESRKTKIDPLSISKCCSLDTFNSF